MITTPIHTSRKLEKLVQKVVQAPSPIAYDTGVLGKWNANLFYFSRKKCWLVTNARTRYSVILKDINSSNLKDIEIILKDNLFSQLIYDGIFIEYAEVDRLLGTIQLHPTDNDRSTIGFQNEHFAAIDYRKEQYGSLNNFPLRKINNQLNTYPFYNKKISSSTLTTASQEVKSLLHR